MDAAFSTASSASDSQHHGHLIKNRDLDSATLSSGDALSVSRNYMYTASSDEFSTIRPLNLNESSRVQELTINKLRYDDVKFVGREVESEILHSRLERMMTTASASAAEDHQPEVAASRSLEMPLIRNKEMILIKGYSGCGKSALASKLKEWTSECENGLVVQGKFEIATKTPYSGVVQAFAGICNNLQQAMDSDVESKKGSVMKIGEELISELGSELRQVVSLIPELRSILPDDFEARISGRFEDDEKFEAAQEQWKNAFRVLTRVFGYYLSPLVLILDDLQWSDMASLSVIEFLLTDAQNTNPLMVVGCYRSNEVGDTHELTRMISSLAEKTEKGTLKLTEIELGNVSPEDTNKVVMALLGIDDEEITKELAQVCFNRTLGNPFFLIQFVTMLDAEGLIMFNLGLLKWIWDVEVVERSTMSTNNVVAMLVARMKKLPDDIQLLLQYAANLGASFKENLVQQIWSLHSSNRDSNRRASNLQKMYGILQKGHYIEKSRIGSYNWVHDKVQEAALALGKASDPDFQFEIGTILYHNLDENDLDQSLFDVVNLVNKGGAQRHIVFSQLNLRAARKARSLSAFDIAALYCSHGVVLLHDEKWSPMHRELTLALLVLGCEMELAAGNVEGMERYAAEVIGRDDCTTLDKFPVYLSLAHKHIIVLQYAKAVELYLSVYRGLGCSWPRSKAWMAVQGLRGIMKISKMSRKKKVDYYGSLPLVTDERQKAIMTLLIQICSIAMMADDAAIMLFGAVRAHDMIMQCGICEATGAMLSFMSVMVMGLKDFEAALYFTKASIKIQQKAPSRYHEAMVLFIASYGSLTWKERLQQCENLAFKSYCLGVKSGNYFWSFWSLASHCVYFPIQQGKPLRSTLAEAARCISLMEEAHQSDPANTCKMFCQAMDNLTSESEQQGKWIDAGWVPPTKMMQSDMKFSRLIVFVFFGKYEEAADLALEIGDNYEKIYPGFFFCQFEALMRGVPLFAMSRRTKKRKYRRAAERILRMVDGWVKKGNPNVKQYSCLLKAEQAASRRKHLEAESLYNEAIVISARTGQLHIAGLANQRHADYLLVDRKDEEEARYRVEQAIRFYTEWGADAVVERLRTGLE